MNQFAVLSLFPEVIETFVSHSMLKRAKASGLISIQTIQIRDFSKDKHRSVDDTPFGGGAGMVIRADVMFDAWIGACKSFKGLSADAFNALDQWTNDRMMPKVSVAESLDESNGQMPVDGTEMSSLVAALKEVTHTILVSPQGPVFDFNRARELANLIQTKNIILICGHYEGIDERFIEECVDEECSLGDFVLTGGELPAAAILDAVSRFIPGVLGNAQSADSDSFERKIDQQLVLKHAQYTKPKIFHGRTVPAVLLSGNHKEIDAYRRKESVLRTNRKRPDLQPVSKPDLPNRSKKG